MSIAKFDSLESMLINNYVIVIARGEGFIAVNLPGVTQGQGWLTSP